MQAGVKYKEYFPAGEKSRYTDSASGELVLISRKTVCLGIVNQSPDANYLKCIEGFSPGKPAETATGAASAEVVEVDAQLSTRSSIQIQSVKIINEFARHLWQARILHMNQLLWHGNFKDVHITTRVTSSRRNDSTCSVSLCLELM